MRLCDALPGEGLERDGEPGSRFGARGSGLLLLAVEADELLPRDALLLEDPARMRDDHVGGMAAAARHRNAAFAVRRSGTISNKRVYVADQKPQGG